MAGEGDEQKRRLVVVGGGSAGWMTAAFLSKVFGLEAGSPYSITLIDSEEVPALGVGEATVHTMRQFLAAAGIQEGEFLVASDATLKHGILFRDWLTGLSSPEADQYFHPFESYPPIAPEHMVNHWLNATLRGACHDRYDRWAGIQGALAAAGASPKAWQAKPYEGTVPYGYHLDANKFAAFLKEVATRRGVNHARDHIVDAAFGEKGHVESIILRSGQRVEGDFFIDCSGFSSILIRRLGANFRSFSNHLLVDRAVTARIPRSESAYSPRPYTTATARKHGWTFEIDLASRTGMGYVYSSAHITPEAAEQEFRSYLGREHESLPVAHFKTRIGRLEEVWINNCLAVGLSAGFLEPLESTGLYFIELALRLFVDYLDLDAGNEPLRVAYNKAAAQIFDEVAQFIVLHYFLSQRRDTAFWRDVSSQSVLVGALEEKLRLWDFKAPTDSDFIGPATPFGAPNYSAILFGMKRLTKVIPNPVRHISAEQSLLHYKNLQNVQRNAIAGQPKHDEYLRKYTAAFS